jgi:hypothetical protein
MTKGVDPTTESATFEPLHMTARTGLISAPIEALGIVA